MEDHCGPPGLAAGLTCAAAELHALTRQQAAAGTGALIIIAAVVRCSQRGSLAADLQRSEKPGQAVSDASFRCKTMLPGKQLRLRQHSCKVPLIHTC